MPTVVAGQAARFTVTIKENGKPVAVAGAIKARLYSVDGVTPLFNAFDLAADTAGADWGNGIVAVTLDDGTTGSLLPASPMVMLVITGPNFVKRFRVDVESAGSFQRSDLFVKDFIVEELRQDKLALMAQSFFSGVALTDDFLWRMIVAAESEIKHRLRVPLVPTQFFPEQPTSEQLAAIGSMPWAIDPAYDYDADFFRGERWGFIVTRNKPIGSIQRIRLAYPSPTISFFEFPADWIRFDSKYGHIRFVPASSTFAAPLSAFVLRALSGGRTLPFSIHVQYVAGLVDAERAYPELLDAIKKMAVLKIVEDGFVPQSGSISGDGLSQSMSVDMSKYRETIDTIIDGPKGSNGGLMAAIHGIRGTVFGN